MGLASKASLDVIAFSTVPKTTARQKSVSTAPALPYLLRRSPVHGSGLFATRDIAKGEQILEYVGERISHAEADRRHARKADDDGHTFLFTIDAKTVIDAGVGGNVSRFINHSCDPNCEVILDEGRPMIEALQKIKNGDELAYDYNLTRSDDDEPEVEKIFACRCGAASCRGTMLAPKKKRTAKASGKKVSANKKVGAKTKTKTNTKARKTKARKKSPKTTTKKRAA